MIGNIALKNSKKLMLGLMERYPRHILKLAHVKEEQETIVLDGEHISMSWIPHVDKIKDKTVVPVLLKDVSRAIDIHLGILEEEDDNEKTD